MAATAVTSEYAAGYETAVVGQGVGLVRVPLPAEATSDTPTPGYAASAGTLVVNRLIAVCTVLGGRSPQFPKPMLTTAGPSVYAWLSPCTIGPQSSADGSTLLNATAARGATPTPHRLFASPATRLPTCVPC